MLRNASIGVKLYGVLGIVFALSVASTDYLLWVLTDTGSGYARLSLRQGGLVQEMRIRGDLQNLGRQIMTGETEELASVAGRFHYGQGSPAHAAASRAPSRTGSRKAARSA